MKIVKIEKIELVRKNFILNIFNETIAFKLPYTIENDIKKEYGFSINKEGKVALCDDLSSNNLDFNLEINKILTIVKTFEEVYGKIVFDILAMYNTFQKNIFVTQHSYEETLFQMLTIALENRLPTLQECERCHNV